MSFYFDQTITLIFSYIHFWLWNAVPLLTLKRRYSLPVTLAGIFIGSLLYLLTPFLPMFSELRMLSLLLIQAAVTVSLYQGRWYFKLFLSALCIVPMVLAELVMVTFVPAELLDPGIAIAQQLVLYVVHLFILTVLVGGLAAVLRLFTIGRLSTVRPVSVLPFLLFPVSQYFAMVGWFSADYPYLNVSTAFAVGAILMFIASDVGLVLAVSTVAKSAALRAQNEALAEQVEAEKEHYAALAANYEDIRRMRHDIANHIYAIRALIADGRSEDAAAYADELTAERLVPMALIPGCEEPAVASFLAHRQRELQTNGIALECRTALPRDTGILSSELICALGNLLDNASEACAGLKDPVIRLSARTERDYLCFEVTNPRIAQEGPKTRRIPGLSRGRGQEILRQLAESRDGYYTAEESGSEYRARLYLKL